MRELERGRRGESLLYCKGRGKGLGTKSIIRMPIFDGASYPIYYTKAVLGLRARAQGIS